MLWRRAVVRIVRSESGFLSNLRKILSAVYLLKLQAENKLTVPRMNMNDIKHLKFDEFNAFDYKQQSISLRHCVSISLCVTISAKYPKLN